VATVSGGLASKLAAMVSGGLASKPVATVSDGFASKPVVTVFFSLASKLVVTVSPDLASKPRWWRVSRFRHQNTKSPRWFLSLSLKIKWVSVCQLLHKTDGVKSARDTRRDLAACFVWKQVWLGFLSLT
jgi:hypothetical protein